MNSGTLHTFMTGMFVLGIGHRAVGMPLTKLDPASDPYFDNDGYSIGDTGLNFTGITEITKTGLHVFGLASEN